MWLTDRQVESLGIDSAQTAQAVADARDVYGYIDAHPWATNDQMAQAAEARWGAEGPTRLAAALQLLVKARKVHQIDPDVKAAVEAQQP